jgi:hypothetical protein
MSNATKEVIIHVAMLAAGLIFVLWLGYFFNSYKCKTYSKVTSLETRYEFAGGCFVKTEKGWFLREQLRDIQH